MKEKTVLVVEDDALNRKLVRTMLTSGNRKVLETQDAESGIRMAREQRPDLVLMDIQLPGMDGLEATRILKADPALKDVPVVALTSYAMQGDRERALDAGCDGYITKPIDTRNFLPSLERFFAVDRSQARDWEEIDHRSRVLIVDDEPLNIKLLAANLSPERFEVLRACSGRQALETALSESPDLILLDVMMPEMDGFEVTRRLKEEPATRNIPVILITALDGSDNKARGLEAGAEEFLNKPVNRMELLSRIHSMVRLKRYSEQLSIRTESGSRFAQGPEEPDNGEGKPAVVLVVEDDARDAELIRGYLRGEPYCVEAAADGESAMARARKGPVDLILLDILLPGMDGFEVCRVLKGDEATRDIQVVLVTCLQALECRVKGIEVGADDYLIKPIDRRELGARIRALLKKKAHLDRLKAQWEKALGSAMNDPVTGLYTRAYFEQFLDLEVKRCIRQRYPLAITLIQVDLGPSEDAPVSAPVPDTALRQMAALVKTNVREVDVAARYEGRLFVVAQPYADRKGAAKAAQRIGQAGAAHGLDAGGGGDAGGMRMRMGIAACTGQGCSAQELIREAIRDLHCLAGGEKEAGR